MATRDELFAVVEELSRVAAAENYPHTLTAEHAGTGHVLSLVVGADRSFVQFYRGDDREMNPWESQGSGVAGPVLTFYFDSHHSELAADECIPAAVALDALGEFCETGNRPRNVEWRRAW